MNERKNQNHLERGWAPFRMSEMVQRGESRSSLTDDLKEGKPTMLFNRKRKTSPVMRAGKIALATFLSALLAGNAIAQNQKTVPDVTAMSMEDLMNMQVTSVSKRTQKVADAAAAIFVITQEDIRRSGATSIPEANVLLCDHENHTRGHSAFGSHQHPRSAAACSRPRSGSHRRK